MADQDPDDAKLELPKLSLRRRKRDEAPTEVVAATEPEEPTEDRPTEIFAEVPTDDEPDEPVEPPRERRPRTMPHVDARVGAVLAGLVSGLVGVALTAAFQKGCEVVKGTGSCGGVGLLLLIVVLIAMSLVASTLLKAFRIPDALSTAFLGVGLLAVITLLFLLDSIDRWYMVVVIPLVAAATFVLSWWATAKFGSSDEVRAT